MTIQRQFFLTISLLGLTTVALGSAPAPRGLINLGQTCYLNSGLQVIASLDGLNKEVKALGSTGYKADSPSLDYLLFTHGNATMRVNRPLVAQFFANKKMVEGTGEKRTERVSTASDAHDAHEYITWLLEHLSDDDMLDTQGTKKMYAGTTQRISPLSAQYYIETQSRLVHNGKTISQKSDFEPYILASIAGQTKLAACIEQFMAPEAGVEYKHEGQDIFVEKQRSFVKLPDYLFVGLKRTERDPVTGRLVRHADKITFPLRNLMEALRPNAERLGLTDQDEYDLVAIAVQAGSATGGHYKAYTKYGATWYQCNDESATIKTDAEMVEFASKGHDKDGFLPTLFVYKKRVINPHEAQDYAMALSIASDDWRKVRLEREARDAEVKALKQVREEEEKRAAQEKAAQEAADREAALALAREESIAQQAAEQKEFIKKAKAAKKKELAAREQAAHEQAAREEAARAQEVTGEQEMNRKITTHEMTSRDEVSREDVTIIEQEVHSPQRRTKAERVAALYKAAAEIAQREKELSLK